MIPHFSSLKKVTKELQREEKLVIRKVSRTYFFPNFLFLTQFNLTHCHLGSVELCEGLRSVIVMNSRRQGAV